LKFDSALQQSLFDVVEHSFQIDPPPHRDSAAGSLVGPGDLREH